MADDIIVKKTEPAPGVAAYNKLIAGGFSAQEANTWRDEETNKLRGGGFSEQEIADYWGDKKPDMKAMEAYTNANLAKADPKVADDPLEIFAAGWDISVTGLALKGKPKTILPQDAGLMSRLLSGFGTFAGDIPAIVAGFVGGAAGGGTVGGAAGEAVGGPPGAAVGAVIGTGMGAGYGSGALPEAMRGVLMDYYEHGYGDMTWKDFMARSSDIALNSAKAGVIGMVAQPVGGAVGGRVLGATGSRMAAGVAEAGTFAVTATGVGSALEGRVPDAKDFVTAATLTLGFYAAGAAAARSKPMIDRVAQNMRDIYRATGEMPFAQQVRARADKAFWQRLNSRNPDGEVVPGPDRPLEPPPYKVETVEVTAPRSDASVLQFPDRKTQVELGRLLPDFVNDHIQGERRLNTANDQPIDLRTAGQAEIAAEFERRLGHPVRGPEDREQFGRMFAQERYEQGFYKKDPEFVEDANRHSREQKFDHSDRRHSLFDEEGRPLAKQNSEFTPEDGLEIINNLERSDAAAKSSGVPVDQVTSPKGAVGRYQIMPDTAKQYGFDPARLTDPAYNREVAEAILTDLMKRFRKPDGTVDMEAVLISYNAGPGRAQAYIRNGRDFKSLPAETQRYLERADRMGAFEPPPGGGGKGGEPPKPPKDEGFASDGKPERLEGHGVAMTPEMMVDKIGDIFAQPMRKSPMQWAKDQVRRFNFEVMSELAPAERLDAQLGIPKTDLGIADGFRQVYGSVSRAWHRLYIGGIGFDIPEGKAGFYKNDAPPLMSIYDNAKKKGSIEELIAVRQAARTVELAERGLKTPTDPALAAELLKSDLGRKYQEELLIAQKANDAKIDDYIASGMMSKEAGEKMKSENRNWFPQVPEKEATLANKKGPRFGAMPVIKKIKGHENQIQHPAVQEIKTFYSMAAMADKNRATGALLNALTKEEKETIGLVRIEDKTTKVELFDKDGNPIPDAMDKTMPPMKDGTQEFVHFENGVGNHYKVDDPQLAQMIAGMAPVKPDQALGILRWFASLKRSGITDMPDFIARAMMKDTVGAAIISKWGGVPYVNTLRGLFHIVKKDKVFQDFVANGGLGASLSDMDANWVARDLHRMVEKGGFFSGTINTFKHPLEAAQVAMQRVDAATRLGIFMKAQEAGLSPFKAGVEARRGTLDFAEKSAGQFTQIMASLVPFYRPGILDIKRMKEAFTERPVQTMTKSAVYIAAPTMALYLMNYLADKDLPEAQKFSNLPRDQKDTMFISPPIAGVRIRVPMPPVLGVLVGGMTNRALDYFLQDDPKAFDEWATTALMQLVPPVIPAAVLPIIEANAAWNSFQDRRLIPAALEEASGYEQFVANTSETAKAIARFLGPAKLNAMDVSPIVLDNYVKQWTGGLGSAVLKSLDATWRKLDIVPEGAPKEWSDNPFIGSMFARNPGLSAAPIEQFYRNLEPVKRAHRDLSLAIERNDIADIDFTSKDAKAYLKLTQITSAMAQQRQAIAAIAADEKMTQDEKRQYISDIASGMIQVAKGGNQLLDSLDGAR